MTIEEIAQKTIERIVEQIAGKSYKEAQKIVQQELANYSQAVQKLIWREIEEAVAGLYIQDPAIAPTPLVLSKLLFDNAIALSKQIVAVLKESIEAKEPLRQIALKIYEGYGFKDKEILEATKVLPKYLQDGIKKRSKHLQKRIEKLRTKPLRLAYKQIAKYIDMWSEEELQRLLQTAYYEKMRYYAKRIAETEAHRAKMAVRAKAYLEDERIELVRFEMSPKHPKPDICDFYANLDVGYGKGIVPKSQMRTLPLHPFCKCVYAPYYGKKRGKAKPWKQAVKDTMAGFSKKEQKEILATYEMLRRFEDGEDIEKLFNALRPKYPIRRYVDILDSKDYNLSMREPTKEELKEFLEVDRKIFERVQALNIDNFKDLWVSERECEKHIEKRLKKGHISSIDDYIKNIKECVIDPDEVYFRKYYKEVKEKFKRWDRIYYKKNSMWVAIFNEKSKINTAFFVTRDFVKDVLLKGDKEQFKILVIDTKELKNERRS